MNTDEAIKMLNLMIEPNQHRNNEAIKMAVQALRNKGQTDNHTEPLPMTKEEAIHHLHTYSTTMGSGQTTDKQHEEAKRIAIKALYEKDALIQTIIKQAEAIDKLQDTLSNVTYIERRLRVDQDQADQDPAEDPGDMHRRGRD